MLWSSQRLRSASTTATTTDTATVLAEGPLLKKSAWLGRWDSRYFVLKLVASSHVELLYWLTEADRRREPPRGTFVIRSSRRHRGGPSRMRR
jgi:hypothetical protein